MSNNDFVKQYARLISRPRRRQSSGAVWRRFFRHFLPQKRAIATGSKLSLARLLLACFNSWQFHSFIDSLYEALFWTCLVRSCRRRCLAGRRREAERQKAFLWFEAFFVAFDDVGFGGKRNLILNPKSQRSGSLLQRAKKRAAKSERQRRRKKRKKRKRIEANGSEENHSHEVLGEKASLLCVHGYK